MSFDNRRIINKLEQIQKRLEMEADKLIVDTEAKFQLEITKSVLDYSSNLMKEKIAKVMNEEIEKFKFIKIIIDYSQTSESEQLEKILLALESERSNIISTTGPDAQIIQNVDDFTKRITIDFSYELGTSVIDEFTNNVLKKLREEKIGS
ncbi:MAG: hypothetical protein ACTSVY_14870 [Candidatus Helarchaeota archaeon]